MGSCGPGAFPQMTGDFRQLKVVRPTQIQFDGLKELGNAKKSQMRAPAGWVTRLCVAVFILLVILLHFFDRSLDPIRFTISQYAMGNTSLLMTFAFATLGTSTIVMGLGLFARIA